jgi:hypothetical protein
MMIICRWFVPIDLAACPVHLRWNLSFSSTLSGFSMFAPVAVSSIGGRLRKQI